MYGFSGYGCSAYGSERQNSSLVAQVVRFGARVFQDVYGKAIAFMRYGSTRTFNDPTQSQTMKLPA